MTKKAAKAKDESLVPVLIYGNTYNVRAEEDRVYIEELARYVDMKMRTLAESTGTEDPLKIAILAALNVADELFKAGEQRRETETELVASMDAMLETLETSMRSPVETSPAKP